MKTKTIQYSDESLGVREQGLSCTNKLDDVYVMTSLPLLKTENSTGPIRLSQRQDIPRMHFTGVNMLILAQQPMTVQELCSRYRSGAGSGYVAKT